MNAVKNSKTIKVKLVKRIGGRLPNHRNCVRGLGLRRIGHEVEIIDTPSNRGMMAKVHYLLEVKEGVS